MARKVLAVAWALVLVAAGAVRGQGLEQSVPGDAIVYVGWAGAESLGEPYEQSHLKGVLEGSQIRQLYTDFLPRVFQMLARDEPEMGPVAEVIRTLAEPMWKYPTAVYFGGVDTTDPDHPVPHLAIYIRAGGDAPRLAQRLSAAVAKLDEVPFAVTAAEENGVLVTVVGSLPVAETSLAQSQRYTTAMAKVGNEGVLSMYIDVEAALALVDRLVETDSGDGAEGWKAVKAGLNLEGIKRIAYRGGFSGPDWSDGMFIEAPAPRTGLAALLDVQPMDPAQLAVIPRDATLAMAGRSDLSRLLKEVRDGLQKASPDAREALEAGLGKLREATGVDLEQDLIDPMGDQWTLYAATSVGGNGLMGAALVVKLDDPGRVERALGRLAQLANEAMAKNAEDVTLAFKQTEVAGLQVNYFAIPLVSPSWAIQDGNLYVGVYPQVVVGAAKHVRSGAPGLAANEKYQDLRRRLGTPEGATVQFIDMEARVPSGYTAMLGFVRMYLGIADMSGVQSPAMFMPPLHVLMAHMSPAGAGYWSDEHGTYMRSIEPFPGSTQLATMDMGSFVVGQQAMMMSILLPSLNRARETANRVKCASNMRQLGQAMLLYSNENRHTYPPDLGTLLKTQDVSIEVFICPSSADRVPAEIRNAGVDEQAAWVNANASYVYIGAGRLAQNVGLADVLLYEKDGNHDGDGMNVLYGDGHVSFNAMEAARRDIEQTLQRKRD